jgi:hypothetical protein
VNRDSTYPECPTLQTRERGCQDQPLLPSPWEPEAKPQFQALFLVGTSDIRHHWPLTPYPASALP